MAALTDLTLITCSFNTPAVTLSMLRSFVHHHGPGPHHVLIMENSTDDETRRLLDGHRVPYVANPGGTHSRSVDLALDRCATRYALLVDTDVIFNRSIQAPLACVLRHDLALMGQVGASRGGYHLRPRVHPWFCFIDVDLIRRHRIRFHDEERIRLSCSGGFYRNLPLQPRPEPGSPPLYDVGATFYEDIDRAGLRIGHAVMEPEFFTHYEGLSWTGNTGDARLEQRTRETLGSLHRDAARYSKIDICGCYLAGFREDGAVPDGRLPERVSPQIGGGRP